jgi:hypothetical protein
MLHFIYKTTHIDSGRYYIGRHSTKNENDRYFGSGKWIKSVKDKSKLSREIIAYCQTYEELLIAEEQELRKHINEELNMNYNNKSIGFACGVLNPAKSEKERSRRSKENWMKTEEGRQFFSKNNPSKKKSNKIQRTVKSLEQFIDGTHNFQKTEVREKIISAAKTRFIENNPMKTVSNKISFSKKQKSLVENENHNFQINREKINELSRHRFITNNPMKNSKISSLFKQPKKQVTCPHCLKTGGKPVMMRYHFNNCKTVSNHKHNKSATAVESKL